VIIKGAEMENGHRAGDRNPIRVGVVGVGRGVSFAQGASDIVGMKLVALCDTWEDRLLEAGKKFGVTTYTDYDKFLEHEMDAVILANYFNEHTPFAIKALRAGKHVMSETAANTTLAEGVALCREVERSGKIYQFAENYPFTRFNMEMRRLYQAGEIGRVTYADGEYNHPIDPESMIKLSPGVKHWRNWLPSTYYCTHALAPLMYITDTRPISVNALSIPALEVSENLPRYNDPGSVILCRMDNGSVFRLFGLWLPGHSCWYRLHGTRGAVEITRGPGYFGPEQVRVWHEEWDLRPGEVAERVYSPEWPEHGELAEQAGHSGGDFWTNYAFAKAIRTGEQPYFDVYRGAEMSSVGILAWKSALENGAPFAAPDFRCETARALYEHDHWSPWPQHASPGQPPPSTRGLIEPKPEAVEVARRIWAEMGYKDSDNL
jgi:predicted dehydrogenase